MQTGLPPSRTDSMQLVPIIRFLRICLRVGQIGTVCLMLLSLNASLVRGQQAPASPNAELPPSSRITLRVGSQGTQVSELQAMLRLLGYYSGAVDGVYQESTAIAVTAFQQAAGLTADGIVGPSTWERLLPASPSVSGVSSSTGAIAPSTANPAIPDTAETTAATLAFPAPSSIEPTATSTATANATEPANTASNSTPAASANTPEAATSASAGDSDEANAQSSAQSDTQSNAQSNVDLPILRVGMRGPAVARLQERLRATGFFSGVIDGVFGTETQNAVRAAQRNLDLEPDGVVGPATWGALLR